MALTVSLWQVIKKGAGMDLSLVIPCFNESDSIDQMRAQLNAIRPELARRGSFELVLVDDGSTDDTYERLKAAFADWEHVRLHDTSAIAVLALRCAPVSPTRVAR